MPYLKEIKKMQESLRCDGYTQIKIKDMEKITVTREELLKACAMIGVDDHNAYRLVKSLEEIRFGLPKIKLSGLNQNIKYVAMDKDGRVFFYLDKPDLNNEWWDYKGTCITDEFIDLSLLDPIKECDWKESLHKVAHQEDDINVKLSNTIENIQSIDKQLSNIKLSKDYLNSLKNS